MKTIKQPTELEIFNTLRRVISKKIKKNLDFRKHVYLENPHGLTPTFNYEFAEGVVRAAHAAVEEFIDENKMLFLHYNGFTFNTAIDCEKLRTSSLKQMLSHIAHELHGLCSGDITVNWLYTGQYDDNELGNGVVEVRYGDTPIHAGGSLTVQLCNSYYMPQHGCEVHTEDDLDDEVQAILIKVAEDFAYAYRRASNVFYFTDFNCSSNHRSAYVRKNKVTNEYSVIIKNGGFNSQGYDTLYEGESRKFNSLKEARQFLKGYALSYYGLNELISDLAMGGN